MGACGPRGGGSSSVIQSNNIGNTNDNDLTWRKGFDRLACVQQALLARLAIYDGPLDRGPPAGGCYPFILDECWLPTVPLARQILALVPALQRGLADLGSECGDRKDVSGSLNKGLPEGPPRVEGGWSR